MKKSYLNSERNTALLLKPSKVFRLLMVVLFVSLFSLVTNAQILQRGSFTSNAVTFTGVGRAISINKPIGVVAGDILIASIVQNETDNDNGGLSNISTSGWTLISGALIRSDGTGSGDNAWWGTYLYRIADGTEGTSFSFAIPNDRADMAIGNIVAFSGVAVTGGVQSNGTAGGPFDIASSAFTTATTNNPTVSAITTVTPNAAVILLAQVSDDNTFSNWVDGSASLVLGELFDSPTTNGDDAGIGAAWGILSSAGTTGICEVDMSGSDRWGAILIALRPCTANPTITTSGTAASVCFSTSAQTTTLPYTATTSSPTSYSIDWNAAANTAGLADQTFTSYTFLSGAGNMPNIAIPASLVSATYSGTLTIRTSGGCRNTQAISVTVNPINTVGAASSTPTICIDNALPAAITHTTTGATGIGTPTGLPSGVNATWALNTITINGTATASGTFNYSIPLAGGCGSLNATGTITVNPNNTVGTASATPTLCINTALATAITHATTGATGIGTPLNLPAGVSASWSANTITISGTPSASGTFNYSIPLVGGCGSVLNATGTITVTANNTVSAASSSPVLCVSTLMPDITHTTTGATGIGAATNLPAGVSAAWASNTITISGTPTAFGTFNYSIPLTGGCGSLNATGTITVNPNNTVGTASATPTLCINTALATAITHATTGATGIGTPLNLPAGVSASWSANTITISGTPSASGTFNYSIPLVGGCGSVLNATGTITVQDPVAAAGTITGTTPVCQGEMGVAYSVPAIANTTGYNWTLPIGATIASGANTNSITVNFAANASSGNISVYGNNTCGNGISASFPVTVNTLSTAPTGISGTTTICNGDSTTLTVTGGIVGIGATAEWFTDSCGGTSAGTGNSITVSPSSTTTYYVRYSGTCNTTTCTSVSVTVNTLSVAPTAITGTSTICQGTSTTLSVSGGLAGTAAVAQWFTGSCGGTSAGTGNSLTVSPITTTTYYVRYSGTCNTTVCASINVIVNPLPLPAGGITGLPTVCQGQNGVAYSVGAITNATSYTWTLPSGAAIASGANTNSITVDYATTATAGNITVRGTNSCGDGAITVFPVAVNSLPTAAGVITGSATVCQGQNGVVYSVPAIANAATYSWTLPSGALITAGANTNSITVNYSVTAASGDVTVYGINPCGNGVSANRAITVNPLPIAAGVILGTATVCQGQNGVVYSVPTITNATGYAWVLPTGATIASGTNTNSITVNFSTTAISGNVTVNGTNACGSGVTADFPVTVNPLPAAAGAITGTTPVCQGQINVVYSVPAIANATTYIWTLPSGASISAGAGTNSIMVDYTMTAVSGNITVKGNNACGDGIISANYPVTVNITPNITTNFSTTACSGLPATVTPTNGGGNIVPVGTTYSWGLPTVTGGITGATAMSGQTSFNQTLTNPTNTAQTASYNVTATTGGCSASTFSVLVTVNPKPVGSVTSPISPICSGGAIPSIVFSETTGIAGTIDYNWTRIDATAITGITGTGSGTITGNLTNTTNSPLTAVFRVIATTQNGCDSLPFDVSVVVNPIPTLAATPSANQTVCSESPITNIALSNPNGVSGIISYSWTRTNNNANLTGIPDGSGTTISGTLTNTTNAAITTVFTITALANGCPSSSTTVSITVNPKPTVAATNTTQNICGNTNIAPIVITNTNTVAGTVLSWTRNNTVNVTGIPDGTGTTISGALVNTTSTDQVVIFTIRAQSGTCFSTTTATITVKPTPVIAITNTPQTRCSGVAILTMGLSDTRLSGTTFTWTRDNTANLTGIAASGSGNSITGTLSHIPTSTTTQTTTFTITATAANGCSSTTTATVTVYAPLVAPVISSAQTVCVFSTPATLTATTPTGGSGVYTYQWQSSPNASGGPWTNVGTNSSSYSPPFISSSANDLYYQLVVTNLCGTVTSNTIWVEVITNVGFTFDLSDTPSGSLCPGSSFTPNISAIHLPSSYVRYVWSANSAYISPSTGGPVGSTTNLFFVSVSSADIGPLTTINNTNATVVTQVTVTPNVYNSSNNNFICSGTPSIVNVTIYPKPTATATVPNAVICNVTSAGIVVRGNIIDSGNTTTFNWSVNNNTNVTGDNTSGSGSIAVGGTYTINNTLTNTSLSPQQVTYTITPSSNGCTGTPITVTIVVAPTIGAGTVGAAQTICSGDTPAAFTQTGAPSGGSSYGYQWYSSTTSATGPWAIIGGATATGYSAPALTQNTWYQRVVTATVTTSPPATTGVTYTATSNSCTANNTAIAVTINTINPGSVSGDQTICSGGDPVAFTSVAATGTAISYQWQSNTTGCGGTWVDIPGASATLASGIYDVPSGLLVTTYYRRKATSTLSGKACVAYSNCITVNVNNVTAGTVGSDQTICGNNPDAFTVITAATGSGVLSYQWQSNTTGCGGSWGNITVNGTSATYDPPPGLLATTYYRRVVTSTLNGNSCSVNGNCITVTANSVTAGAISGNRTICAGGDPDAFTETTPATGTGLTYQWQYSLVGGAGPWTDVSGATDETYDAPGPISQTTFYQRVVKASANGTDCYAYSGFVVVYVNNVTPSVISGNQSVCGSADPVAFTVSTAATGTGTLSYQWQSSTTSASGPWSNIPFATSAAYDAGPVAQTTYYQSVITSTLNGAPCSTISNSVVVTYIALPPTPIVGVTTLPDCVTATGSVVLSGLPAGNWTINPGGITGNTPSVTISGLAANTYNFTVYNGTCTSLPTANVVIPVVTTAIWNGTTWTNGPPTINQPLEFTGSYDSSGDLTACSCTVTSGAVVFKPNNTLKITNWVHVNGGSLTFENTASLVQINNVSNTNSGNILYERETTKITKMDYTYWATPVSPFTLGGVSPNTSGDKMYSYDYSIDDWKQESPATSMIPGMGYIMRGPQNYVPPMPPSTYKAPFVGVPNNGHYEITGVIPDGSYLLGNPYPSALDADSFLVANKDVLNGTLYFWTHNTPIAIGTPDPGSGLYAYSGNDYAAYNATGGVGAAPPDIDPVTGLPYPGQAPSSVPPFTGLNDNIPSGKIASGQGFFGSSKVTPTGSTIVYNNNMRVGVGAITGDNSQFFKTKDSKIKTATELEKHRIWLNLTNIQGAFKQTLVGYVTDATNGYEDRFDGESYDGNDFLDFYSVNQEKNLTIQGRALPFDVNDEIPLGYRVALDGTFTIKIGKTDGMLSNQTVYLEDKLTNSVFNLKEGNYTFTTTAGTFDDRFVLRYTDKTLSTEDLELNDGITVLYSNNYKTLIIRNNVKEATVNSVSLYNMAGQNIANWDVKGREQTSIQIPIKNLPSEIYIVKVKTTKGESSKKIIIK